jgi:23S rRNA (adenine2503-C2)-methyltransferase
LTKETASSERAIDEFARELGRRGVNVTIRNTRGRNIDAACGQLRLLAGKPGLKPIPDGPKGV